MRAAVFERSAVLHLAAAALGVGAGVITYGGLALTGQRVADPVVVLAVAITVALALGGLVLRVAPRVLWNLRALPFRWRRAVVVGALLLPGFAAIVTPIELPYPDAPVVLELRSVRGVATEAQGEEVWLLDAAFDIGAQGFEGFNAPLRGGTRLNPEAWIPGDGWEDRGWAWLAPYGGGGPLRWEGRGHWRKVAFRFTSHPWSGAVEIRQGGRTETILLTRQDNRPVTVQFELRPPWPAALVTWGLGGMLWLWASVLLVAGCSWIGTRAAVPRPRIRVPFWAIFGAVLAGQAIYLAAFHPGLMSADSLDQWGQGFVGPIHDYHPALHTLVHRIVSRTFGTPVVIVLLQQAAYAALAALWVRELGRLGAPLWSLIVTTAFAALWLVPGVLNVTIWKDVPYSIGVVALAYGLLRQVSTEGAWLRTARGFVGLTVAMVGVMVLRHNGLLAGAATLLALLLLPGSKRRTFALAGTVLLLLFLVRGPLYRSMDIHKTPRSFALQNQVHQMSALVASGTRLSPETRNMLEAIQPMESWGQRYYCYTLTPNYYNDTFNRRAFDERMEPFLKALVNLGWRSPGALVDRQLCVTSYLWRVLQPENAYLYTHSPRIDPNRFGLEVTPVDEAWNRFMLETIETSVTRPVPLHLIWRPAFWNYLVLFGTMLAALRIRRARLLWILVPVLANAASLMVLTPSQSMRYGYSAHLMGIFLLGLLLIRPWEAPRQNAAYPG